MSSMHTPNSRDESAAAFKRGDRVKVTDGNAPWCGYEGTVMRCSGGVRGPYERWMVALDALHGQEVAHYKKELTRVEAD